MRKRSLLSGNFETARPAELVEEEKEEAGAEFQREVLKKLGGSIAFVRGVDHLVEEE